MLVCGIDLETSGLDAKKERITEIGAVIFDATTWEPKDNFSTFVFTPGVPELSAKIHELTGITDDMLIGAPLLAQAVKDVDDFAKDCKYFIAHNAKFDRGMLGENMKRNNIDATPGFKARDWLCSKSDLKHEGMKCLTLSHLALDYGVAVDPSKLHRALGDVFLMGQMLAKAKADPDAMHAFASIPWVYLEAQLPSGGNWTAAKEEAKKHGYGWEKAPGSYDPVFPKRWIKRIKETELDAEKAKVPKLFKRITVKA